MNEQLFKLSIGEVMYRLNEVVKLMESAYTYLDKSYTWSAEDEREAIERLKTGEEPDYEAEYTQIMETVIKPSHSQIGLAKDILKTLIS